MKKRCCAIVFALCLSVTSVFGQMILTEEDNGLNPRATADPNFTVMIPLQDINLDQWEYLPLSDSLLLLTGLGGAYLLQKKRRQKTEDRRQN